MRWDLIDRFDSLERGKRARARKTFTGKEDFFDEHYPGRPRVPEPLYVEMVAQTGGVLYGFGLEFKKEVILAKIDRAAFGAPVAPPCDLTVEARIAEEREEGAWIEGVVRHDGKQAADVRLLLVAMDGLEGGKKKIVFNDKMLSHYDVFAVAGRSESKR